MIHIIGFNVFLAFCLIFSLRSGGQPERLAMLAQVGAALSTILAIQVLPRFTAFSGNAPALFSIDVILLLALVWLAMRANRTWTIVLAGLQLSTVIVHLSKAAYPALPAASYGVFAQFWAWPMLVTTFAGIFQHRARVKRLGYEPDWKPLWPRSVPAEFTI
jgi:hypothetical protein